jgi:Protein of unknown function (DUF2854)
MLSITKIPLGLLCLSAGGVITVVGFAAYFLDYAALNMIGFFYGIPLMLGGIALKITELKPVPLMQTTPSDVLDLRSQQATDTQTQIFKDVTRFRYGQKAHLDTALKFLGLSPNDKERPELIGIQETQVNDQYALVLLFDSPYVPYENWQRKQDKMTSFFGPNVRVEVEQPEPEEVKVTIVATPA